MYFSAKRRFNPGTSDSQLNGENSNELLFMVGTPNILFPLVAYHGRVLIKFNTYFPVVGSLSGKGTRNTKSKS
nr:MAG TPA: hypothetical protein [Caudoviricetes sp.]